jgi:hypothetical protein
MKGSEHDDYEFSSRAQTYQDSYDKPFGYDQYILLQSANAGRLLSVIDQ